MSETPRVVILGGGLAGMAAAHALGERGGVRVTILEHGPELGGLAGSFRRGPYFYPLSYHHILHRDSVLLGFLDRLGILPRVRWRRIRMLFRLNERFYDLARLADFARFPMSLGDKLRFVRLMLRAFRKSNWDDWQERSAQDLVDGWGGPGVRTAIFERLSRLKFGLPCAEVSGAWLGARLYFREGSHALGYVPGDNWTRLLCTGLGQRLGELGIEMRTQASVNRLHARGERVVEVELRSGERLPADRVISTVPTEVYRELLPEDDTPEIAGVRYTAVLSLVCATRQVVEPIFYWMNLASLDHQACGIFRLDSLNPTIGGPGEACINFVSHVPSRMSALFRRGEEELTAGYLVDFERVFGFRLQPLWTRLARIPMYSPVFVRGYLNPPLRSKSFANVYFAGNFRTHPSIASTGTALGSGIEAGQAVLADTGRAGPEADSRRRD